MNEILSSNKTKVEHMQKAHAYFIENTFALSEIQAFMRMCGFILQTGDKVFTIDQKSRTITVPVISNEAWNKIIITWKTRRTTLYEGLIDLKTTMPDFLPSINQILLTQRKALTVQDIMSLVIDIVSCMNAHIERERKKGNIHYRSIHYGNDTISLPFKPKIEKVQKKVKQEIVSTIVGNTIDIPDMTFNHFIEYINKSTFPIKINERGQVLVDRFKAKKIDDLLSPHLYKVEIDHTEQPFYMLLDICLQKYPQFFDIKDSVLQQSYYKKPLRNGEKNAFYKKFFEGIIMGYMVKIGGKIEFMYDDYTQVQSGWLQEFLLSIKGGKVLHKIDTINHTTSGTQNTDTEYKRKKKIIYSEENHTKEVTLELLIGLGYSKKFATSLMGFCKQHILKNKTDDTFSIAEIAHYRLKLHPATIDELHKNIHTSFYIKAFDRTFDAYLADKSSSNKEWFMTHIGKTKEHI